MTHVPHDKQKELVIRVLNDEYKVIVCFGGVKEVRKCLKAWHYPLDFDLAGSLQDMRGRCFSKKNCHPIIALPRRPKTAEEIGTLAHETTHAIDWIFQSIGETHTEEIYAHCVGAVVREVLKSR